MLHVVWILDAEEERKILNEWEKGESGREIMTVKDKRGKKDKVIGKEEVIF